MATHRAHPSHGKRNRDPVHPEYRHPCYLRDLKWQRRSVFPDVIMSGLKFPDDKRIEVRFRLWW